MEKWFCAGTGGAAACAAFTPGRHPQQPWRDQLLAPKMGLHRAYGMTLRWAGKRGHWWCNIPQGSLKRPSGLVQNKGVLGSPKLCTKFKCLKHQKQTVLCYGAVQQPHQVALDVRGAQGSAAWPRLNICPP
eukprot:scaffold9665_cov21-Tisochrysis_lutea.AAC.3